MLTRREFDEIETYFYWMEEDVMAKDEILKYLKNNYVIGTSTFSSEAADRTASCMRNITNETVSRVYKECYVPSRETKEECWERMNGHQICCQVAADVARNMQKQKKKIDYLFKERMKETEDNIKYLKERIAGIDHSIKLCELKEGNMTAEKINIRRIEDLEAVVSVLCHIVMEFFGEAYEDRKKI